MKTIITLILIASLSNNAFAAGKNFINKIEIDLIISAQDEGSGMGLGALMRFSNDGINWSADEPYNSSKKLWSLAGHGGSDDDGIHTIYAQVADLAGNWSEVFTAEIIVDRTRPNGSMTVVIHLGP